MAKFNDQSGYICYPDGKYGVEQMHNDYLGFSPDKHIFFSGSFNPLHDGHKEIAKEVEKITQKTVVFLIPIKHPYKQVANYEELFIRKKYFEWYATIVFLNEYGLYANIARLFPGFSFILGSDALTRMLDLKKYPVEGIDSVENLLALFVKLNTKFYVSRRDNLESIYSLIPDKFQNLFIELKTMSSLSSTQIRNSQLHN